jgi:hypothetical protein
MRGPFVLADVDPTSALSFAQMHSSDCKGKICTRSCTQVTDYPSPSPGCTPNNGVCRAP